MNPFPAFLRVLGLGVAFGVGVLQAQFTESTTTVAPGRFLLEMDALSVSLDHDQNGNYTAIGVAETFLTTGLTKDWDVQVGAQFFIDQEFDNNGLNDRSSGMGDVFIRTKWRFYESEETYTSIALLPYVKLPTSSGGVGNDAVEGGLIVPFQTELMGGFNFTAMGQLAFLRNAADDGYDSYWLVSAYVHRQLIKVIGIYGEAAAAKSSGGAPWEGTLGAGATLAITENLSLDYAIYRGLSSGAADWNHVLRLNWGF